MKIFGYTISKKEEGATPLASIIKPEITDGAIQATNNVFGMSFSAEYKNQTELIDIYRNMASDGYVESAVEDIVNECIVTEFNIKTAALDLSETEFSDKIKKLIDEEYDVVLKLLSFNRQGAALFRKWYVDGLIYAYKTPKSDKNNVAGFTQINEKNGLSSVKILDPRHVNFIREEDKITKEISEYYLYTDISLDKANEAIKIAPDAMTRVTSGSYDKSGRVLSYLHPAIKPYNQITHLEDSVVVYRIVRAPERRVIFVDVGELPKTQAEQYMKGLMNNNRNKLSYDATTGKVKESTNMRSMLEDMWIPRRNGSRGTEVETLPGGQNLGDIADILYFKKRLLNALKIPASRVDPDTQSMFGGGNKNEISRDELKFTKYAGKLRNRFSVLLLDILKTQLILKKIITAEEWDTAFEDMYIVFNDDSHFAEAKASELLASRILNLQAANEYVGTYFSKKGVMMDILRMTEEDIKDLEKEIKEEGTEPEDGESPLGTPGGTLAVAPEEVEAPAPAAEPKPKPEPKDDKKDAK